MRIFVIHVGNILACPPVLNLINILEDMHIESRVVTTKSDFVNDHPEYACVSITELPFHYESDRGLLKKFGNMFRIRKQLWKIISAEYKEDDLIWITSNIDLKHLGGRIVNTNYVLQLMELSEHLRYHNKFPFRLNKSKIGNRALAVVVPEYNRAHITKAWWNLDNLPLIMQNKPYTKEDFCKNAEISDPEAKRIVDSLTGKKIILYQGIIHRERPLDKYIKAIEQLGDEYAFVLMSGGENVYKDINSKNYYFIPYVKAPKHLEITSHAYIGVLSYFPTVSEYSILNALFCAPNKTYEYAKFGIPMIGNDVPGLKEIFESTNCGVCIREFNEDTICQAIKYIESNYEKMSKGAIEYYENTDLMCEVKTILDTVQKRMYK